MPDDVRQILGTCTRELEARYDGSVSRQQRQAAEAEDRRQDELRHEIAYAAANNEGMTLTADEVARLNDILTWGPPRRSA